MPKVYKLIWSFVILSFVLSLVFFGVSYKKRIWKDESRLTYFDLSNPIQLRSIDPVTKEAVFINLPQNLEVESVDGRGIWLLGKIAKAGTEDWVLESLRWHFGIVDLRSRSDLTLWDWWRVQTLKKSIPEKNIDLTETGLITLEKTSDGLEIYKLSPHWYLQSPDWFSSANLIRQNLNVSIVNTTFQSGLGSRVTRSLETMGIKVQTLSTSGDNLKRCRLTFSSQVQKLPGFLILQNLFKCEKIINESPGLNIKLELGQDWAIKLFGS